MSDAMDLGEFWQRIDAFATTLTFCADDAEFERVGLHGYRYGLSLRWTDDFMGSSDVEYFRAGHVRPLPDDRTTGERAMVVGWFAGPRALTDRVEVYALHGVHRPPGADQTAMAG